MAIPVISDLPPAPTRSDGPGDFTPKADAMIGALQPLVLQINIATQWMAGQLTEAQAQAAAASAAATAAAASAAAASASKNAAAQSAIDATENGAAQVALAEEQVALAVNAKSAAEVAAVAAGAAAGLPEERVPYSVLQINPAGNVAWGDGLIDKTTAAPGQALMLGSGKVPKWDFPGQQIGDILTTARDPGALYLPANGTIRSQSAYAELFAKVGLIGGNVGVSWPELDAGTAYQVCALGVSISGTILAFQVTAPTTMRRSADRGNTWSSITMPLGNNSGGTLDTDGFGTWVYACSYSTQVLRSTDDGVTWSIITVPAAMSPGGYTWTRAKYCGAGTWIVTQNGTNGQVLRSTNNGQSFTAVASGASASGGPIDTNGKGLIIVGFGTATRKSADYGATWSAGPVSGSATVVSITNDKNGIWVITTSDAANSQTGIYRSLDDGATFSPFPIASYSGGITWAVIAYGLIFFRIPAAAGSPKLYVYVGNGMVQLYSDSVNAGGPSDMLRVQDAGNGTLIGMSSTTTSKLVRSVPQYPYDTATQFALPNVTPAPGTKAYIKAKELA